MSKISCGTIIYEIEIRNLPQKTTWQKLKDWIHHAEGQEINVYHVIVDEKSGCGWIQFTEETDYSQAFEFLRLKKEWKKTPFEVYISKRPRAHVTDSQHMRGYPNQIYSRASVGGYASGPALPLTNNSYPATLAQTSGYYNPAPPQSNNLYTASNSGYGSGSNVPLSTPDSRGIALVDIPPPERFVPAQSRGIHVSKLDHKISETDIRNLITGELRIRQDEILEVRLHSNASDRRKIYALVTFGTNEMAQRATRVLDGITYRKHCLVVKMDKDHQTIYPPEPLTAGYDVNYQVEGHYRHNSVEMVDRSTLSYPSSYSVPITTVRTPYRQTEQPSSTYSVTYKAGEEVPRQSSSPDNTKPVVVDGSKDRYEGQSSSQQGKHTGTAQLNKGRIEKSSGMQERSERGDSKSTKNHKNDSKGKQKNKKK